MQPSRTLLLLTPLQCSNLSCILTRAFVLLLQLFSKGFTVSLPRRSSSSSNNGARSLSLQLQI